MARVLTTAHIGRKIRDTTIPGLVVVANKKFVQEAMDLEGVGEKSLTYLKKIFPKSPPEYPRLGRAPLVEGWRLYMHPKKGFNPDQVGFSIRRSPIGGFQGQERDTEIILALDQGSRAYTRNVPKGQITSIFVTSAQAYNPALAAIGDTVFMTGNDEIIRYKARRGRKFMDKTYKYMMGLVEKARAKYKQLARKKLKDG